MYLTNITISTIVLVIYFIETGHNLLTRPIKKFSFSFIISFLITVICLAGVYLLFSNFTRSIVDFVIMAIFFAYIFNESYFRSLVASFIAFIYLFVSEILLSIFLFFVIGIDRTNITNHWAGASITNLIIASLALFLFQFEKPKSFLLKLVNNSGSSKYGEILLISILAMGILTNKNILSFGATNQFILNLMLIGIFMIVLIYLFQEKGRRTLLSQKYDQLFNYIQRYEKELTNKNIIIHNYKNQLISLKGFLHKKNIEGHAYLNSIIDDLKKTDTQLLNDMENVPEGGLKGLIYYKLGDLHKEKIQVFTDINPNVAKSHLSKIKPDFYKDIVKIVGVLLDNAIESSRISKKKQIVLEMYFEKEQFNLILSNTYDGKLDIEKFHDIGYSTKGKGRGYGLYLVNQIINKNNNIEYSNRVINDYYEVHLKANLKTFHTVK